MNAVLEVLSPGTSAGIQDLGRTGWKKFGVPPGGAMDQVSMRLANLLVGNEPSLPVLELLFTGACFRALQRCELAVTGAQVETGHARGRSFLLEPGEELAFAHLSAGVWSYLAVRGGFDAPRWFGSASVYPRAGMGNFLQRGDVLQSRAVSAGPGAIAGRFFPEGSLPRFDLIPEISVWRGPEWEMLPESSRQAFLSTEWIVSPKSDRSGYRLEGADVFTGGLTILSSPVTVGTMQLPPGGQPIVILRDGPTVGGYPRLVILDPEAVSRFAQCAPGAKVRFALRDEKGLR